MLINVTNYTKEKPTLLRPDKKLIFNRGISLALLFRRFFGRGFFLFFTFLFFCFFFCGFLRHFFFHKILRKTGYKNVPKIIIYAPRYLNASYTRKAGHTNALRNPKTPIQNPVAWEM